MNSAKLCERLHQVLEKYPEYRHPIQWDALPANGVYFFYERGEVWGHGGTRPRIVRVGTHRQGNLVSRLKSHHVEDTKIDRISVDTACPKDRSIFRKNIGRALLVKEKSAYLPLWNIDWQIEANRKLSGAARNVEFEKTVERDISRVLRDEFSFKVIPTGRHESIIGGNGLEARLIGTLSHCDCCAPSRDWLGCYSPVPEIRKGKLWLVQPLSKGALEESDRVLCQAGSSLS
jgi:hypothetical protein